MRALQADSLLSESPGKPNEGLANSIIFITVGCQQTIWPLREVCQEFPGGPVVNTLHLCARMQVQSLVRELRSHMLSLPTSVVESFGRKEKYPHTLFKPLFNCHLLRCAFSDLLPTNTASHSESSYLPYFSS